MISINLKEAFSLLPEKHRKELIQHVFKSLHEDGKPTEEEISFWFTNPEKSGLGNKYMEKTLKLFLSAYLMDMKTIKNRIYSIWAE